MDYFDILRTNRDKELIQRLSNPINSDAYTEPSRDELWDRFVNEHQIELQMAFEEELEDWELDNLLDGQEDDTVDETIEPLYCNAVYNENRRKSNHTSIPSDLAIPEKFFTWSQLAQDTWVSKRIEEHGYEAVKNLFEEDS